MTKGARKRGFPLKRAIYTTTKKKPPERVAFFVCRLCAMGYLSLLSVLCFFSISYIIIIIVVMIISPYPLIKASIKSSIPSFTDKHNKMIAIAKSHKVSFQYSVDCLFMYFPVRLQKSAELKHTAVPAPEVSRMIGDVNICAVNSVVALQKAANFAG